MKSYPLLFACISLLSGCGTEYRFAFPRENRPVCSSFIAQSEFKLAGSPAPEIALFNVVAEPGRSRPGVVAYVPTEIETATDPSGPKVWKHLHGCSVEFEIVAMPAIPREKFEQLRSALTAASPGVTPTLVPCEVLLNSVEIPGTLEGASVRFTPYYVASGDLFWIIRLRAPLRVANRLEDLMKSETGLILPCRATLKGVDLPIAPPIEIKASLPVPDR
jgi:hypothetical protein